MNRRLLGATAVVVLLLAAAGAVITLTGGSATGNPETVAELAATADQQREAATTAVDVAGSIVTPLGLGASIGLGVGLLGGTTYAYRNRGMR